MRPCTTLCFVALCSLSGCYQPIITPRLPDLQSAEVTIRDWNTIAHRIASALASRGLVPSESTDVLMSAPAAVSVKAVFVRVQAPDSAFINEVAIELERDILSGGGTIARTPSNATVVNLDVDFVKCGPRPHRADFGGDYAEAIWQASVVTGDRVIMQLQRPMYIQTQDIPLYSKTVNLSRSVSWNDNAAALPARQIRLAP
jgi:hypothetical protein